MFVNPPIQKNIKYFYFQIDMFFKLNQFGPRLMKQKLLVQISLNIYI